MLHRLDGILLSLVFVNDKKLVTKNYEKFVKNQFRHYLGFEGTPISFFWRNK